MKRILYPLIFAVLIAAHLSCCVPSAQEPEIPEAQEEQIVLRIMHKKQEAPDTYRKLAEAFHEKYPHISVEYEVPTDYDLALQRSMNRNETPDLYTATALEANAGLLRDLSQEAFLSQVRLPHYDTVTRPGEYFFPVGYAGAGILCNENLLTKYGLELPRTLEDLEHIHHTLSKHNVSTFALGFQDLWTIHYSFCPAYYAVYAKYPDWNHLRFEGETSFASTPEWQEAADVVKNYVYAYGNQETAFESGYMDACQMLAHNQAAMLVQGSWAAAIIEDYNSDTSLRMIPLPVSNDPENGRINFYCDYSLSISAGTKHPREALLYLEFLSSREAAEIYVENTGSFSGVIDAPIPDNNISRDIQSYVEAGRYVDNPPEGWPPRFYIDAERLLSEYLFDGIDYTAMTEALDAAWDLRTETQ